MVFSICSLLGLFFIAATLSILSLMLNSQTLSTNTFNLLFCVVIFNHSHQLFCIFHCFQKIILVSLIFDGAINWVVTARVFDDFCIIFSENLLLSE
jgi:hypothetical protein